MKKAKSIANSRLYLRPKDLMILAGRGEKWARKEMEFIRAVLNKKLIPDPNNPGRLVKPPVTLREYCELYDLDENELREKLL